MYRKGVLCIYIYKPQQLAWRSIQSNNGTMKISHLCKISNQNFNDTLLPT